MKIRYTPRYAAGSDIDDLMRLLAKLPGFGMRSARRAALALVTNKKFLLTPLAKTLEEVKNNVKACSECGNIDTENPCRICTDPDRDSRTLIVVESVPDLWALERSEVIFAKYHVLGGVLSALDAVRPEDISLTQLVNRCCDPSIEEVVIALNPTIEGQVTAHYISDQLDTLDKEKRIKITRLAYGVPLGGELDYLDAGTISQALIARTKL